MIVVDRPLWRWRGRRWAHLASDQDFAELHAFAARLGMRREWFQGDHYDLPDERWDDAVALGATPVTARELVRRLLARLAYEAIGARGMARVDLFYADGEVLVNEINTIPGFTAASMFPYVWATQGLDAPALVQRLLDLALAAADRDGRFSP